MLTALGIFFSEPFLGFTKLTLQFLRAEQIFAFGAVRSSCFLDLLYWRPYLPRIML
jgi:hypothetical protein